MESASATYFTALEFENVRCFGPRQRLDLSDGQGGWARWTLLLGENGTGKTTVLQLLAASVIRGKTSPSIPPDTFSAGDVVVEHSDGFWLRWQPHKNGASWRNSDPLAHVYLVGYGAHRQSIEHMIELDKTGADATLFSPDAGLIDAQAWLLQLDYAAKSNPLFQAQLDQVKQTLLSVLPDVSDVRIVGPGARDAKATATPSSALVECETPYGWVPMDQLSLGYQSTLTWVVDLVARMYHRYPESENPLAEPVVVLIDELDLHLHPRWQREVIGYLSARFPKAQFIATAHSPLVVQAAEGANIAVFRREGDHVVIDQDHQNIRGWRVDQLLTSDLFGLESARSPEVAAQRARRIELLNTPQRSPAQEAELAKLREALSALPTESTPEKQRALDLLTQALGHLKAGP